MSKTSYILSYQGSPCAVINAESQSNLKDKLERAIKEEVGADEEGQFTLTIGEMGDWGEDTNIDTTYVVDGEQFDDDEFVLMKTVSY